MSVSQDLKASNYLIASFHKDVIPLLRKHHYFDTRELTDAFWSDFRQISKKKNKAIYLQLEELIRRSYRTGGKAVEKAAAETLMQKTKLELADDYLKKRGGVFITQTTNTDRKKIIDIIRADPHMDERELGRRISKSYMCSESRGRMIARTESHTGREWGGYHYAESLDMGIKTWNTVGDDRVRLSHQVMNQEMALIDQPFSNGRMVADEIGCRCRILYRRRSKVNPQIIKQLESKAGPMSRLPPPGVPVSGFPRR